MIQERLASDALDFVEVVGRQCGKPLVQSSGQFGRIKGGVAVEYGCRFEVDLLVHHGERWLQISSQKLGPVHFVAFEYKFVDHDA